MAKDNNKQLLDKIEELRIRLSEAEETLSSIRSGGVDAIVVSGLQGEQVFTLTGAERAYRILIETMNEGAASLNQEGMIIYCNQRFSEMVKTPLEKVIGVPLRQFVRVFDLQVFDDLMEKGARENGKGEVSLINNDGAELPVLLSISASQKDNANIRGITVTDLTAQKHVENELERHRDHLEELVKNRTNELERSNQQLQVEIRERKQREEKILNLAREWQKTFDAIPSSVFLLDIEGRITRCNKATELLLGKTQDEIIGLSCWGLMHGTDKPIPECPMLAMKKDLKRTSVVMPDKDRWLQVTVDPILDEAGELIGAVHTIDDVTEKKKAEDALHEASEFNRQIIESAQEGIVVYGPDLKYQGWNSFMERLTGLPAAEVLGRHPLEVFPFLRDAGVMEGIEKALTGEVSEAERFQFHINKTGRSGWASEISAPLKNAKGEIIGVIGTARDITEHRKLEDQLRHAQKMEAVGTLAGGIAHDFNNILNVIIGYGSMVRGRMEADDLSREQLNEVLAAAERAAILTKRLLVFSRKQMVDVKLININETILGVQKMLARMIRENIDFKLDLTDRPLAAMADTGQIEQVLMNLATNAKDAMPEGGRLTIGTGIQVLDDEYVAAYGYGKPGKYALITITDTGCGMDADTQGKIFEPFFTTKGIGEGIGLGLAISYGIIKQHSGYIKVYSELGKGTEFKIYLPLLEEAVLINKKIEAPDSVKGGNETILAAEDDPSLRKLSRIVLESLGYTVITAEDGEDAIKKFMENRDKIQLVILDMIMPKKSGKEVSEAIRKKSPRAKILFLSGYTMDTIKSREITEAGFDFMHKPVIPRDLLKKVREILDR